MQTGSVRRNARDGIRASVRAAVVVAVVVGLSGCDGGEDAVDTSSDGDAPVAGTVAVPEARSSPFCQAMIDLGDRLLTDPPDDQAQLVIETYESIADDVPDEIAADFDAVLAGLKGEAPPSTGGPPDDSAPVSSDATSTGPITAPDGSLVDEFIVPPATPAERLNEYVEFTCRSTVNNPGPPATAPVLDVSDEDDTDDG